MQTKTKLIWLGVGIVGVIILSGALAGDPSTPTAQPVAADPQAEPWRPDAAPPEPAEDRPAWVYETSVDELTDKEMRLACVTSTNQVRLDFPYRDTYAQLCLRDHPKLGRDVILSLKGNGQILCRSYDGCAVSVRFDKTPVQSFSAAGASDGSSEVIFITNRKRFEAGMSGADETLVAIELYQAGRQTLSFPTKGFAWPGGETAG